MSQRSLPTLLALLALLAVPGAFALTGCGDKPAEEDDATDETAGADSRTAVSSGLRAAERAAGGALAADLAAAAPSDSGSARRGGLDPVTPDFGGPQGRLIAGWSGLKAGMKPKDLRRMRPLARGSDLTGLVYTETLDSPWIAASYRFERLSSDIAHVQWLAGPLASGLPVFRGMSKQGLHRWRKRPTFTEDAEHRRAHFETPDGPMLLSMATADGRIKLEWRPPPKDGPDTLQAALDRIASPRYAGAAGDVGKGKRATPAGARAAAGTNAGTPARPDGAPPVSRP